MAQDHENKAHYLSHYYEAMVVAEKVVKERGFAVSVAATYQCSNDVIEGAK